MSERFASAFAFEHFDGSWEVLWQEPDDASIEYAPNNNAGSIPALEVPAPARVARVEFHLAQRIASTSRLNKRVRQVEATVSRGSPRAPHTSSGWVLKRMQAARVTPAIDSASSIIDLAEERNKRRPSQAAA